MASGGLTPAVTVSIAGWLGCGYYGRAKTCLLGLNILVPEVQVEIVEFPSAATYEEWLVTFRPTLGPRAVDHETSPIVWLNGKDFLGGCDRALEWIRTGYMAGSSVSRPSRVLIDRDPVVRGDGTGFDFDLVVIGGGSGGLACGKEAALLGAKVCVLDFVKPSWAGSTWGLGGTCVNVGCIPKKLMHNASLLGEGMTDARAFGWQLPEGIKHDWNALVSAVHDHIASLNFGYGVALREKGAIYKNALGSFKDPHTIECVDKKGKRTEIRARRIVIAVGGRPRALEIPGGEHAISSDDIFALDHAPGKTLVVGASYVALECAGFLRGLGYDVSVMVRSILLRGFDQQIANLIGEDMEVTHGVRFIRSCVPTAITKLEGGRLSVRFKNPETSEVREETYDTVLTATGRVADTAKLGLPLAGVDVEADGKLRVEADQTNVPHVFAIGDVVQGNPELTPVAIAAGKLLARRLYGGGTQGVEHHLIPTTVFTPLEYGCCGLSEEDAMTKLGEANVEVYHSALTPLEWTIGDHRPANKCYAKIIVNKADSNRVVGFHVLSPHAGEITQGWACALRLGATYESFCTTIGIHPTIAEEFTLLAITKSSGESADKGGC